MYSKIERGWNKDNIKKAFRNSDEAMLVVGEVCSTMGAPELNLFRMLTAAYILQKDGYWASETKRHPSWKITRHLWPIPLVVKIGELGDRSAALLFEVAEEIRDEKQIKTYFEVRNLANKVSDFYAKGAEESSNAEQHTQLDRRDFLLNLIQQSINRQEKINK